MCACPACRGEATWKTIPFWISALDKGLACHAPRSEDRVGPGPGYQGMMSFVARDLSLHRTSSRHRLLSRMPSIYCGCSLGRYVHQCVICVILCPPCHHRDGDRGTDGQIHRECRRTRRLAYRAPAQPLNCQPKQPSRPPRRGLIKVLINQLQS